MKSLLTLLALASPLLLLAPAAPAFAEGSEAAGSIVLNQEIVIADSDVHQADSSWAYGKKLENFAGYSACILEYSSASPVTLAQGTVLRGKLNKVDQMAFRPSDAMSGFGSIVTYVFFTTDSFWIQGRCEKAKFSLYSVPTEPELEGDLQPYFSIQR